MNGCCIRIMPNKKFEILGMNIEFKKDNSVPTLAGISATSNNIDMKGQAMKARNGLIQYLTSVRRKECE